MATVRTWAGLHEAVKQAVDPMGLMQRVADEAMRAIAGAEGVLVGLVHGDEWLSFVCGAGHLARQVGNRISLGSSLSGLAVRTGATLRCDDTETDGRVDLPSARAYRVASSVCVPLRRGELALGVLNVSSSRPRAFGESDVTTLTKLAGFVSVVVAAAADLTAVTESLLSPARLHPLVSSDGDYLALEERFVANVLSPGAIGGLEALGRIERTLAGERMTHFFQPIFELWNGGLYALEALARFSGKPKRPPDQWFAEARAVGLGPELEVASIRLALEVLEDLPPHVALCVNAGPQALVHKEALQLLLQSDARRVIVELTEQVPVDDYPGLSGSLDRLRRRGVRLAIDDTGAGFASLAHILKLGPDLIKLDRALTSGIDRDPVRRALAEALVRFAEHTKAQIIAEGIESRAELDVLRELGIGYGQGYYLGRPRALESVCWRPVHSIGWTRPPSIGRARREANPLARAATAG